jgi:hypothetical protein
MTAFTRLPNVFAWEDGQQWYYVRDQSRAPKNAAEAWHFHDGQAVVIAISRGTSGAFIRDEKIWNGASLGGG